MNTYKVSLSRLYNVIVDAQNKEDAKQAVETFLSSSKDTSTIREQTQYNFKIREIEMMGNEVFESQEIKNIDNISSTN